MHTVRTIGRLAQMIIELRDEYVERPRPDLLVQIDQRLTDLEALQDELRARMSRSITRRVTGSCSVQLEPALGVVPGLTTGSPRRQSGQSDASQVAISMVASAMYGTPRSASPPLRSTSTARPATSTG